MKRFQLSLLLVWLFSFSHSEPSVVSDGAKQDADDNEHLGRNNKAPNYWGCTSHNQSLRELPFCNASLSIEERLNDLMNRLTLKEKIAMLSPQSNLGDTCATHTASVSRIGLPQYMWLVETNTAVASHCLSHKCATEFSGPLSIAASFNRTSWYLKGSVFGTEQRAFMNIHWHRGGQYIPHNQALEGIGLTAFGPNINQQRDPRFGRTSELPGEDPYLSGEYAKQMVNGMQERDSNGYPKVLAYLKHFAAYSKEADRGRDAYNISTFDLFDTYLPQFEKAFVEANATGAMCSYNGINGVPSCANSYLLNDILRNQWGRPDAHITTDCGAVHNLLYPPVHASSNASAAAYALMNGSDIEMGSTLYNDYLLQAIQQGLATEEAVDRALQRSYRPHFVAGRFDPPEKSDWYKLGEKDIYSDQHQAIQLDAALQGLVLLKNDNTNGLPLNAKTTKIAVLGPLGTTREGLMSDYECDQSCVGGGHDCIPTIAESIQAINGPEKTAVASGVDIESNSTAGIWKAMAIGEAADVIVLCLGTTKDQEREGKDREDTKLPGNQEMFAHNVFRLKKPTVLVLVNGGQIALDNLVEKPVAIVEAFNPNGMSIAIAMSIFGLENRWGKLPYTLYPHNVMQDFDMSNYDMTAKPGRTYRYFSGKPIYPFGYGLSLTTFDIVSCQQQHRQGHRAMGTMTIVCRVANTGTRAGDEVLQVYHSVSFKVKDHPVPIKRLINFERIYIGPGQEEKVIFSLDPKRDFELVNQDGKRVLYPGRHKLQITNGVLDGYSLTVDLPLDFADTDTEFSSSS